MVKRPFLLVVFSALMAACATFATAQTMPVNDINAKIHPNLAAAQDFCDRAARKIHAAQEAHEFDLGGHAQKALELLDQANVELKLAAKTAYKNHQ